MVATAHPFARRLLDWTEARLTNRARKRWRQKLKQSRKHPVRDWLEAFLWAAMVVLLINQYALQAYVIPSGSMEKTLLIGDRVFVDKFSYGPELLPGLVKLPGLDKPSRNEVMCFENPSYRSNGTAYMIAQRIIYMLTLSLVDLDRSGLKSGEEMSGDRIYLLIKRVIGIGGEQWRLNNGDFSVKVPGEDWMSESAFKLVSALEYNANRSVPQSTYSDWRRMTDAEMRNILGSQGTFSSDKSEEGIPVRQIVAEIRHRYIPRFAPDHDLALAWNGWYIPEGYILPLGDNRDNSRDGRYFGPVSQEKVLGRAMIIYWPLNRATAVR